MGGRSLLVAAFTDTAAATWFNVVPLRTFPLKPWTIPEGSPKPRLGAVYGGGFAGTRLRAMELITNLNRCHHFQGFIYQHARFTSDKKGIEILVRPRKGSAVPFGVLDFIDADGVDLAERPVFQTPGNDMFDSVENLVQGCAKGLRSLSMTVAAPNGLGRAYKLWSVCVCRRPRGLLRRRQRHSGDSRRASWCTEGRRENPTGG
jgi:hypothetical protein